METSILFTSINDASGLKPAPDAQFMASQVIAARRVDVEMGQLWHFRSFRGCVQRECNCVETIIVKSGDS